MARKAVILAGVITLACLLIMAPTSTSRNSTTSPKEERGQPSRDTKNSAAGQTYEASTQQKATERATEISVAETPPPLKASPRKQQPFFQGKLETGVQVAETPPIAYPLSGTEACTKLYDLVNSLIQSPNDIAYLLPLIKMYLPGQSRVVELGSAYGKSHALLSSSPGISHLVTIDLVITPAVRIISGGSRQCLGPRNNRTLYEKDDVQIEVPFSSIDRGIDLLFLDTLHNNLLLRKELKKYPQHVRTRMLFHDPTSYMVSDEGEEKNPPANHTPGLRQAFLDFMSGNSEWEEEIYFPHNNGLLVLRRKDFDMEGEAEVPWDDSVLKMDEPVVKQQLDTVTIRLVPHRFSSPQERKWTRGVQQGCRNYFVENSAVDAETMHTAREQCCGYTNANGQGDSPFRTMYLNLVVLKPTILPLAPLLPAIYGYNMAVFDRPSLPLYSDVALVGCIPSVALTLLHASSILGNIVHIIDTSCIVNSNTTKRVVVSPELSVSKVPLVFVTAADFEKRADLVFSAVPSLIFVLGAGKLSVEQHKLRAANKYVVDSTVWASVGYVVLRQQDYTLHRYTRQEPSSVLRLPDYPKRMFSRPDGKVFEHIDVVRWKRRLKFMAKKGVAPGKP